MSVKFSSGQESLPRVGGSAPVETEAPSVVKNAPIPVSAKPFEARDFGKIRGKMPYDEVRKKYGPLAATDPARAARADRDRRFALDSGLKGSLSVEEEEEKLIQERVRLRLAALEAQVRADADKRGYSEGYARARAEADEAFSRESAARLARLDALLDGFDQAADEIYRANERYVLEVVFRVAKQIVLKEIGTDPGYVTRLAAQLIARSRARESIRVQVNPADFANLASIHSGLQERLGELANLDVQVAPEVREGGCIVSTDWNSVDASLATQLERAREALVKE